MMRGIINYLIYLFRSDRYFYRNLISLLGFLPGNITLYRHAFTHKSASLKLKNGSNINNERLEYLGDAILGAITAEFIYRQYDNDDEGFMTKLRARIVKRKNLNSTAIKMGIPMLISSHPHPANTSKHLYGNALEALFGAIYLDRGYKYARRFFEKRMIRKFVDMNQLAKKDSDYKSQLIEWAQKYKREVIFNSHEEYDPKVGPPSFESTVSIDQVISGSGIGGSKKEAEQQAAKAALKGISD